MRGTRVPAFKDRDHGDAGDNASRPRPTSTARRPSSAAASAMRAQAELHDAEHRGDRARRPVIASRRWVRWSRPPVSSGTPRRRRETTTSVVSRITSPTSSAAHSSAPSAEVGGAGRRDRHRRRRGSRSACCRRRRGRSATGARGCSAGTRRTHRRARTAKPASCDVVVHEGERADADADGGGDRARGAVEVVHEVERVDEAEHPEDGQRQVQRRPTRTASRPRSPIHSPTAGERLDADAQPRREVDAIVDRADDPQRRGAEDDGRNRSPSAAPQQRGHERRRAARPSRRGTASRGRASCSPRDGRGSPFGPRRAPPAGLRRAPVPPRARTRAPPRSQPARSATAGWMPQTVCTGSCLLG